MGAIAILLLLLWWHYHPRSSPSAATTSRPTRMKSRRRSPAVRAIRERSIVWRKLKKVTECIAQHNVSLFLRAGTWLAAYRQQGYTPFDRDNDFAILDSDVLRFKQIQLPAPFKMVFNEPHTHFQIVPRVQGWPLVDGVVYQTNNRAQDVVDVSRAERFSFAVGDMTNFEELPFYDGFLRAPANSATYLLHRYGDDCLTKQINKCAKHVGSLFKNDSLQCYWPPYRGALDFPHITHQPVRGKIN